MLFSMSLFAKDASSTAKSNVKKPAQALPPGQVYGPQGWIFDLGGQYTWVDIVAADDFDNQGSTGGITAKITYQRPKSFYGQLRSILNMGQTDGGLVGFFSNDEQTYTEWYAEYVSGYCFGIKQHWMITPYGGIGVDALNQRLRSDSALGMNLYYQTYYLLFGCEFRYAMEKWYFSLQADGLPIAEQYLTLGDSNSTTYKLKQSIGTSVRLSAARQLGKHFWLELTPYYRYFPIGKNDSQSMDKQNLNQVGFFLTLRYAI